MQVVEHDETFTSLEKDGRPIFQKSTFILKSRDERWFYAFSDEKIFGNPDLDLGKLDLVEIPIRNVWPDYEENLLRATEPLGRDDYLKEVSLLDIPETKDYKSIGLRILKEAKICEVLKNYPHPNIAEYKGCVVEGGKIRGLCFRKYTMSLSELMDQDCYIDIGRIVRGVLKGTKHLNSLGWIHNDISPANIMIEKGEPILIDFETCRKLGSRMECPIGTFPYAKEDMTRARTENDLHALREIAKELKKRNKQYWG